MISYRRVEQLEAEAAALRARCVLLERAVVAIGDVVELLETSNVTPGLVTAEQMIELSESVDALAQAVGEEPAR